MTDPAPRDLDVAGYVLGVLDAEERKRVEVELERDPLTRQTAEDLGVVAGLMNQAAPPFELPPDLESRTFAAVQQAMAQDGATAQSARVDPPRRRRFGAMRAAMVGGLAAVLLAVGVIAGSQLGAGPDGELEVDTTLRGDGTTATATVREIGIGRTVDFDTDELQILPEGEYYEMWFVGPGDRPGSPNRISAGTFHPDDKGESHVTLKAAVDPAKYPVLAITSEPGDGNPSPSGPDVMRSRPARSPAGP